MTTVLRVVQISLLKKLKMIFLFISKNQKFSQNSGLFQRNIAELETVLVKVNTFHEFEKWSLKANINFKNKLPTVTLNFYKSNFIGVFWKQVFGNLHVHR